ncbi:hypothetical protein [Xanthomonas translucens]|nr:hypothetical protein [Xanthomonas translucens]CCP41129.1 hypothetical protein BN444_02853 [Xanthomonas translucens pv. translucens DSM 18974]MCT8274675.1 hypothetical protein [Xanthomonas translucens pv. translucens]MCT8278538.1 hypothetical protein [Xanthomonas translucens pv. translucens]MCT8307756.1 hypothetical protein [Xanthomonas translucens pv. translucens]WNJ26623.1 hypothetical protein RMA73_17630 [Xanthomonas translucens pv. translucens]
MGIGRCFGSGGSSARYQQDEHAQGSAAPHSPHERDPYQPIALNDPAFAGLPRRVSQVPAHQRGQVANQAALQEVRREGEELRSQIAEQFQQEPALKPILESLDTIIRKINGKLAGSRGSRGPDEYRSEIAQVRRDFKAFNEAASGYQGANFGYSGVLHSGSFGPR